MPHRPDNDQEKRQLTVFLIPKIPESVDLKQLDKFGLERRDLQLLQQIDGTVNIGELAEATDIPLPEVRESLSELLELELIELHEPHGARSHEVREKEELVRRRVRKAAKTSAIPLSLELILVVLVILGGLAWKFVPKKEPVPVAQAQPTPQSSMDKASLLVRRDSSSGTLSKDQPAERQESGQRLVDSLEKAQEEQALAELQLLPGERVDPEDPRFILLEDGQRRWRKPPPGKWFTDSGELSAEARDMGDSSELLPPEGILESESPEASPSEDTSFEELSEDHSSEENDPVSSDEDDL